jgi:hypothetical protein
VDRRQGLAERRERPDVEDRVGVGVAEVQQDRGHRPADAVEQGERLDPYPLVGRAERGPGDRLDVVGAVGGAARQRARALPAAEREEVVPGREAGRADPRTDLALDQVVVGARGVGRGSGVELARPGRHVEVGVAGSRS